MTSIHHILKYMKNLIPYLLLISLYFFFVNFEARKEKKDIKIIDKDYKIPIDISNDEETQLRIKIPIIPYKQ